MTLKKYLPLLFVASLILALDQISKAWVISNFAMGEGFSILAPFLQITRSMNTGIAFGIGEGGSMIFLLLSLIIIIVLLGLYARSTPEALIQHFGYSLVVGGALGNAIDRLQHGHVVDFVHISIPNIVSNVSNFADHAIVLGVLLLVLDGFLQERREKTKIASSTANTEETVIQPDN